ncbi:MAG: YiiX/YebB-like N1pC/P60 family cysteine hydrolase, partial [Balneolaceae bacterium]
MFIFDKLCSRFARFLSKPRDVGMQITTNSPERLSAALKKGDVLLVEGTSRISAAIKYLTQSTWSHSALYIGDALGEPKDGSALLELLEADINEGVRAVPLSNYYHMHTRICRPVGLSEKNINRVVEYATSRLGHQYDTKNILDLARYLIPTPPVP